MNDVIKIYMIFIVKVKLGTNIYFHVWSPCVCVMRHMASSHGNAFLIIDSFHDDVIKWKHFPRYWPFVRGIHRSPVNSLHKGQWRGALMFSFIYAWINCWLNNREAGDLRRYRAHYDVTVLFSEIRPSPVDVPLNAFLMPEPANQIWSSLSQASQKMNGHQQPPWWLHLPSDFYGHCYKKRQLNKWHYTKHPRIFCDVYRHDF